MKELKHCPFCGSEADIWLSYDRRTLFAQCDECQTKSDLFRSIDEAVQAWNRRKIEKDDDWITNEVEEPKKYFTSSCYVKPVVNGEWIEDIQEPFASTYHCSNCGQSPLCEEDWVLSNYCPNCGAEMRERREDDKGRSSIAT